MPGIGSTRLTLAAGGERAAEALAAAGWPCSRRVWLLTLGQFSAADVFEALLTDGGPWSANIMAWHFGLGEFERLLERVRSGVVKECSIITDRSFPARAPAAWSSIVEANAGAVPVSVRLGQVHSKLFFLRAGERHIVCGGSSNWNLVRRVEDFCIEENRALYDDFMVIWDRLWGAAGAVDVPPVGAVRYMRPLVDLSKERGGLTAPPVPKLDVV